MPTPFDMNDIASIRAGGLHPGEVYDEASVAGCILCDCVHHQGIARMILVVSPCVRGEERVE
jgi:hypothetical protein